LWLALSGLWLALPGLWLALPSGPRCIWRPQHRWNILWDFTTLGFWSDNSQRLPEAPSNQNTLCWCSCSELLNCSGITSIFFNSFLLCMFLALLHPCAVILCNRFEECSWCYSMLWYSEVLYIQHYDEISGNG
jgi:hypothetical protein